MLKSVENFWNRTPELMSMRPVSRESLAGILVVPDNKQYEAALINASMFIEVNVWNAKYQSLVDVSMTREQFFAENPEPWWYGWYQPSTIEEQERGYMGRMYQLDIYTDARLPVEQRFNPYTIAIYPFEE